MPDQFVTIQSFTTEIEAEIVKGKLQSEGIASYIIKDDCGGMYPQLRLTQGVLLRVQASDRDLALAVIEPVGFSPARTAAVSFDGKETASILSLNAWIVGIIGLGCTFAGFVAGRLIYIGLALITAALALKFLSYKTGRR